VTQVYPAAAVGLLGVGLEFHQALLLLQLRLLLVRLLVRLLVLLLELLRHHMLHRLHAAARHLREGVYLGAVRGVRVLLQVWQLHCAALRKVVKGAAEGGAAVHEVQPGGGLLLLLLLLEAAAAVGVAGDRDRAQSDLRRGEGQGVVWVAAPAGAACRRTARSTVVSQAPRLVFPGAPQPLRRWLGVSDP
jgi:hypothetical protein